MQSNNFESDRIKLKQVCEVGCCGSENTSCLACYNYNNNNNNNQCMVIYLLQQLFYRQLVMPIIFYCKQERIILIPMALYL